MRIPSLINDPNSIVTTLSKSDSAQLDTIIIGQGLAGSLLAWQLLQQGQQVLVIDNGHTTSSSRPAAGLLNPVTGQRLVKAAQTDEYLAAAQALYTELEQFFDKQFFHPKPMLRLFRKHEEQTIWERRKQDPDYQPYLGVRLTPGQNPLVHDPLGGFHQYHTGYLDTIALLDSLQGFLQLGGHYRRQQIQPDDITVEHDRVSVGGTRALRLIFCEGYKAMENPWFSWLPFKPAKGEILTLKSSVELPDEIINAGNWLLPIDRNTFRFGSNFQWDRLDEVPTDEAREQLLGSLAELLREPAACEVIQQVAGVRPCSKDTAPYLGFHPQHPALGMCNGFGARGTMLIPWHVSCLAETMVGRGTIPPSADIERYWNG